MYQCTQSCMFIFQQTQFPTLPSHHVYRFSTELTSPSSATCSALPPGRRIPTAPPSLPQSGPPPQPRAPPPGPSPPRPPPPQPPPPTEAEEVPQEEGKFTPSKQGKTKFVLLYCQGLYSKEAANSLASLVKLPSIYTSGCCPFAKYWSPHVSLDLPSQSGSACLTVVLF